MATKAALMSDDDRPKKKQEPNALENLGGRVTGVWSEFTGFLSDVRAEMKKVVTPSRKEVEVTTTVVVIAVLIFGVFFFVADSVFDLGIKTLLHKLGGM
jgi:preprotein translocase subunit SecE